MRRRPRRPGRKRRWMQGRFLLSSLAYNTHLQQMAAALAEQDALGLYVTGAVDHWRSPLLRTLRHSPLARMIDADRKLSRRRIEGVPERLIRATWLWEVLQQFSGIVPQSESFGDHCWEKSEHAADRQVARLLKSGEYAGVIATEHQALRSLQTAKAMSRPGILIFTSPHHLTYKRWVEPEYERFPELRTRVTEMLKPRSVRRDARRDEEMEQASHIFCNSGFTARSVIHGGAPPDKVISVPLGCSTPSSRPVDRSPATRLRFLYSGPVSVRKGAQYLLQAWRRFGSANDLELHVCGSLQLPRALAENLPGNIHLHGNVSTAELQQQYDTADFLLFPTLCDGFGLVVGEALARGVPVLTTVNAGAADLVRHRENGLLLPPADLDALAAGIEWIIDHRAELPAMRQAAWETARDWSWADFRREIIHQFETRVLGSSIGAPNEV